MEKLPRMNAPREETERTAEEVPPEAGQQMSMDLDALEE